MVTAGAVYQGLEEAEVMATTADTFIWFSGDKVKKVTGSETRELRRVEGIIWHNTLYMVEIEKVLEDGSFLQVWHLAVMIANETERMIDAYRLASILALAGVRRVSLNAFFMILEFSRSKERTLTTIPIAIDWRNRIQQHMEDIKTVVQIKSQDEELAKALEKISVEEAQTSRGNTAYITEYFEDINIPYLLQPCNEETERMYVKVLHEKEDKMFVKMGYEPDLGIEATILKQQPMNKERLEIWKGIKEADTAQEEKQKKKIIKESHTKKADMDKVIRKRTDTIHPEDDDRIVRKRPDNMYLEADEMLRTSFN